MDTPPACCAASVAPHSATAYALITDEDPREVDIKVRGGGGGGGGCPACFARSSSVGQNPVVKPTPPTPLGPVSSAWSTLLLPPPLPPLLERSNGSGRERGRLLGRGRELEPLRRPPLFLLPGRFRPQYFFRRTGVAQVNLSQYGPIPKWRRPAHRETARTRAAALAARARLSSISSSVRQS
eukprot:COSAG01_NODE_511_length_16061_cov_15.815875_17_plen_182_part_00